MSSFRSNHHSIPTSLRACAITIGNFDGVHLGHQAIVRELCQRAKRLKVRSLAITFDPPPAQLLRSNYRPVMLTTFEQRADLLQAYGVDDVLILETTRELLELEADAFFQQILLGRIDARAIVEGSNFQFGKGRKGTPGVLKAWCDQAGVETAFVTDQMLGERIVSSSVIREEISRGNIDLANQLLGRPYSVAGKVEHGMARGRTIGFPTANLGGIEVLLPSHGVYAGRCFVEGRNYATAIHLGPNVSFSEHETKFECHLLDFQGDLYGQNLTVEFVTKLRETIKFSSIDLLVSQLKSDVQRTSDIILTDRRILL